MESAFLRVNLFIAEIITIEVNVISITVRIVAKKPLSQSFHSKSLFEKVMAKERYKSFVEEPPSCIFKISTQNNCNKLLLFSLYSEHNYSNKSNAN